jgi:sterol desaturase/sphingolipid hydroxylase (fatty acid hydroxylase superfamily)
MDLNMNQEIVIRVGIFIGTLFTMLTWEAFYPRRPASGLRWQRRMNNFMLLCVSNLLSRIILPITVVSTAAIANDSHWGLLNILNAPYWLAFVLSFILLDLIIYAEHVLFHKFKFLWRIHRVHHTDKEFDASTALRFHPLEIIISNASKILAVILLGPPVVAVILFEIVLNASAIFNHSNARINLFIDKYLRWLIVTPDMHRVHHSVIKSETDSNFGFYLPWWDRIFNTYQDQPGAGHDKMQLGQTEFSAKNTVNVVTLLTQPFKNNAMRENT